MSILFSGKESSKTTRKPNGGPANLSQGNMIPSPQFFLRIYINHIKSLGVKQNRKKSTLWILRLWIQKSNDCLKVIASSN